MTDLRLVFGGILERLDQRVLRVVLCVIAYTLSMDSIIIPSYWTPFTLSLSAMCTPRKHEFVSSQVDCNRSDSTMLDV